MKKKLTRPVWVEIDLNNIKYNYNQIKENVSQETFIMAIVKANAYGHGVEEVVRTLIEEEVDRLGVALPEEGKELREAGFKLPIQILGEVLSEQIPLIIDYDLTPTISKADTAEKLNKLAKKQEIKKKVHVKIDTGMGRIGILPEKAVDFILGIKKLSFLKIEGLITHFARADEKDKEYTFKQMKKFKAVLNRLKELGVEIPIKHVANSAIIIDLPELKLDMVRPGIMIYGLPPSMEVDNIKLRPALTWKARIVYLKNVSKKTGISYGTTFFTKKKSKIATLSLGYADGYSRLLSNKGEVLIKGRRAPIVGNICMDQLMVDVTNIPDVKIGDEVILIGSQGNDMITATELADKIGTINYEIICNISERIPRVYIK